VRALGLKFSDMSNAIQTLEPPEALKPWVTGFVLRDEPGGGHVVRMLPDPRASVQIVLGAPYWLRGRDEAGGWVRAPRSGLWGPRFGWSFGWPEGHIKILGFGLTPAALRALTGGPADRVVDQVLALSQFAPRLAMTLEALPTDDMKRMAAAASEALSLALEGHDPATAITPAALDCLATQSSGAVAQAARLYGLSERHFRRVFEEQFGATPKLYQRVRRIDRMIRALHPRPWETDALKDYGTGFADQPHLIREFQALTGLTPEAYARAMARAGGPVLRSVADASIPPPDDACLFPPR
jgi:AraC-like DNA-binding protein